MAKDQSQKPQNHKKVILLSITCAQFL